jgi:hypothetical protein
MHPHPADARNTTHPQLSVHHKYYMHQSHSIYNQDTSLQILKNGGYAAINKLFSEKLDGVTWLNREATML